MSIISPLTFGVEFEFMIKTVDPDSDPEDPEPNETRPLSYAKQEFQFDSIPDNDIHQKVRDVLRANGIPCLEENEDDDTYSKWEVKFDVSVDVSAEERNISYDYNSFEIITPVYYSLKEARTGLDEIRRVLSIIRNNFRVHCPRSAGLHCHVGNGSLGFSTLHMKNLLSIMYVFDKQIQVLHPNRQWDEEDVKKSFPFEAFYRAPSRCSLGLYLTGDPGAFPDFENEEFADNYDTKPDLSIEIMELAGNAYTDEPTEFSQAKRCLNKEREVTRENVRVRQLFASGPETMSGIGSTNIPDSQPGAIAQRLFRNEPLGIPLLEFEKGKPVGPQIHAHLTKHLKGGLDPTIEHYLLNSGSSTTPYMIDAKPAHPDPTTALAPLKLYQTQDMHLLDTLSGTGSRVAAYNINGLAYAEKDNEQRKTIEFRQHQGTLDPDRVIAWVQMVTGMVEWVRFAPPVEIIRLLSLGGKMMPEEFDVVDLLRYMGLDEPAEYYEREFFQAKN